MSKKDWLVERLTGSKKGSPRWVELATALEEYWNTNFFADLKELEDSKNIFTANSKQLDRIVAEQGDFFDVALPIDDSGKRLGIAWRREEIHKKNTIFPINSILNRNFNGLPATWQPIYAPVTGEYDRFHLYTEYELNLLERNLDDYWLTSRGRLLVDLNHMKKIGMSKDEFLLIARREIERVRPTHIVYDGELFILTIEFDYQPLKSGFNRITSSKLGSRYDYLLTSRFDEQPADMPWLDESPLGLSKDRTIREPQAEFEKFGGKPWSLDLFVDLGDRQVPIAGVEGDILAAVKTLSYASKAVAMALSESKVTAGVTDVVKSIHMGYNLHNQFDDFPADVIPTDEPIHASSKTTTRAAVAAFNLGCTWSLDQFVDLGGRQVPVAGIEGDELPPLQRISSTSKGIQVRVKKFAADNQRVKQYTKHLSFDLAPKFDDYPADSMGTDRPIYAVDSLATKKAALVLKRLTASTRSTTKSTSSADVKKGSAASKTSIVKSNTADFDSVPAQSKRAVDKPKHEVKPLKNINSNSELGFDEIPTDFAPLDTPLWT